MLDDLDEEQRNELHRILGDEIFGEVLLYTEDIEDQITSMDPKNELFDEHFDENNLSSSSD
jgi:hypothetical protein